MTILFLALALSLPAGGWASGPGAEGYAGSEACEKCHDRIYRQWKLTPPANMLRDAKKNPGVVAATDFSRVPFRREEILWSVGSHWVQKYLTAIVNEYYVLPNAWDLVKGDWEPYSIFNWRERPYTQSCDGCHATGYDPSTKSFHEPSIGCEACHGPGEKHAASRAAEDIVNPEKLPDDRRDRICESCHTPQVAGGGKRYSIHDHKFDFSGPELPCTKCHAEKEPAGEKAPLHDFSFRRVELEDTLTLEQACARCHKDRVVADALRDWKTISRSIK